ncbi:MAG: alanyl-tRNA editing protein [Halobacteriaceae archaeon]
MARSRAPADPYTTAFEATVESAGTDLVLSETYFYPEGGGQPADRGVLAGERVVDVSERDGAVVHELAADPGVEPGEAVAGQVDESFRTYCMRAHTASHVLYGAGRRLFDDLGYGGFDIDERKVRVDLSGADVDDAALAELERLTNRAVWDSRPVSWEEVPRAEALSRDDVAFNTKTEEGLQSTDAVRLVEVADWDVAACGGTHVENTREIGPVTVLDRSNPGEGLTRVEFAVGPAAVERRAEERRAAAEAARALDASTSDLGEAAREAVSRAERAEADLREARADLLDDRLADLAATERDGATWLTGVVEGFGPNEVGDRVRGLAGDRADVAVVVGEADATFVVAATADGADVDAGAVVDRLTDEFGGGGGGGETFAQGGGLGAAADDVHEAV